MKSHAFIYNVNYYTAVQIQKAVSAYFSSKQTVPFGFARQYYSLQVTSE